MPEVITQLVEAPDPFKGQETTHEEFSKYRETGELPERFQEKETPEAPEKVAETADGQEPSPEQESKDQPRDDKGKFKKVEFSEEQQTAFDRAFRKREAKLRAEYEERIAALESSVKGKAPEAVQEPETPPDSPPEIPDITTWQGTAEEYQKAVKEYPIKLKAYLDAEREAEQQSRSIQTRLAESERAAQQAHPDYKDSFNELAEDVKSGEEPALPQHVLQLIAEESEDAHELTYYLVKNREEYRRLAEIRDPAKALREVLRLEAKIQIAKHSPAPEKKPKPTTAPPPPATVGTRAVVSAFDVNDEKMSADDWARARNEQLAKKGRRF